METSHLQRYFRRIGRFGRHDWVLSIPIARCADVPPWNLDFRGIVVFGYSSSCPFVHSFLPFEQEGGPRGDCHCRSSGIPVHLLKLADEEKGALHFVNRDSSLQVTEH